MTLSRRTPSTSPFAVLYTRQSSTLISSMGLIKTERQTLLDATRTNPESYACTSNRTNSATAAR